MTLDDAIGLVLGRTGLAAANTTYKDRARQYLNAMGKRIVSDMGGKWWFLYKSTTFSTTKTATVSGISGTFVAGETITGGTSGATAVVDTAYDSTNYPTAILVSAVTGTFTASETLTGGTSGATATFSSIAVTQTYALASDVLVPHSFVDDTNDRVIIATNLDRIDAADPDRDYEADGRVWAPEGIDSITGKILVRIHPYHDTPGDTIRYRYRGFITDWTSADDSTDMVRWFPEILQPALWMGAAAMYLLEKGDTEAAGADQGLASDIIDKAKETNRTIYGNREWRRTNVPENPSRFSYVPADGSLT